MLKHRDRRATPATGQKTKKPLTAAEKTVSETMAWEGGRVPIFCTEY